MHDLFRPATVVAALLTLCLSPGRSDAASLPAAPATLAYVGTPAGTGLPYRWTVALGRKQRVAVVSAVGAKSWNEPTNPDGLKGWTHTSNWIAIELRTEAKLKITIERQQGVVTTDGTATLTRDQLVPAASVYSGQDAVSEQDHVFNNAGAFWAAVEFLGNAPNPKAKPKIVLKTRKLPPGLYTVDIGGNPASLGAPANYPVAGCDTSDPTCYAYTGLHGYRATIEAR